MRRSTPAAPLAQRFSFRPLVQLPCHRETSTFCFGPLIYYTRLILWNGGMLRILGSLLHFLSAFEISDASCSLYI